MLLYNAICFIFLGCCVVRGSKTIHVKEYIKAVLTQTFTFQEYNRDKNSSVIWKLPENCTTFQMDTIPAENSFMAVLEIYCPIKENCEGEYYANHDSQFITTVLTFEKANENNDAEVLSAKEKCNIDENKKKQEHIESKNKYTNHYVYGFFTGLAAALVVIGFFFIIVIGYRQNWFSFICQSNSNDVLRSVELTELESRRIESN